MSDREAWIACFNTAFASALAHPGPVLIDGQDVSARAFTKWIADEALKDAPKDHP